MSSEFDDELIFFRPLTPEELLQTTNQQTILTPAEKFARIQKNLDKRARRLRKFHFTAIETTNLLYVFSGEGIEIIQVENSVVGCRLARQVCLELFLSSEPCDRFGGYKFNGPNYENLSDAELEMVMLQTRRSLEFAPFTKEELDSGEYELSKFNLIFCGECNFAFQNKAAKEKHLCTDQFMIREFFPIHTQNFAMESRPKTWHLF